MVGKIQVALIQIDNYGPWTASLGPDREFELQILQARLYADLQTRFSQQGGLVFYNRFDNMLAISNGMSLEQHRAIASEVSSHHPVTVSMGIGVAENPYQAQKAASQQLLKAGGSRSNRRVGAVLAPPHLLEDGAGVVHLAHVDLDNSGLNLTDRLSAFDVSMTMSQIQRTLARYFTARGGLVFYAGGDNFIAPCNGLSEEEIREALEIASKESGANFKAGVGVAPNAKEAMKLANLGLDGMREGVYPKPIHTIMNLPLPKSPTRRA